MLSLLIKFFEDAPHSGSSTIGSMDNYSAVRSSDTPDSCRCLNIISGSLKFPCLHKPEESRGRCASKVSQIATMFQLQDENEEKEEKVALAPSQVTVVRTESHVARFNTARALFEKMSEKKGGGGDQRIQKSGNSQRRNAGGQANTIILGGSIIGRGTPSPSSGSSCGRSLSRSPSPASPRALIHTNGHATPVSKSTAIVSSSIATISSLPSTSPPPTAFHSSIQNTSISTVLPLSSVGNVLPPRNFSDSKEPSRGRWFPPTIKSENSKSKIGKDFFDKTEISLSQSGRDILTKNEIKLKPDFNSKSPLQNNVNNKTEARLVSTSEARLASTFNNKTESTKADAVSKPEHSSKPTKPAKPETLIDKPLSSHLQNQQIIQRHKNWFQTFSRAKSPGSSPVKPHQSQSPSTGSTPEPRSPRDSDRDSCEEYFEKIRSSPSGEEEKTPSKTSRAAFGEVGFNRKLCEESSSSYVVGLPTIQNDWRRERAAILSGRNNHRNSISEDAKNTFDAEQLRSFEDVSTLPSYWSPPKQYNQSVSSYHESSNHEDESSSPVEVNDEGVGQSRLSSDSPLDNGEDLSGQEPPPRTDDYKDVADVHMVVRESIENNRSRVRRGSLETHDQAEIHSVNDGVPNILRKGGADVIVKESLALAANKEKDGHRGLSSDVQVETSVYKAHEAKILSVQLRRNVDAKKTNEETSSYEVDRERRLKEWERRRSERENRFSDEILVHNFKGPAGEGMATSARYSWMKDDKPSRNSFCSDRVTSSRAYNRTSWQEGDDEGSSRRINYNERQENLVKPEEESKRKILEQGLDRERKGDEDFEINKEEKFKQNKELERNIRGEELERKLKEEELDQSRIEEKLDRKLRREDLDQRRREEGWERMNREEELKRKRHEEELERKHREELDFKAVEEELERKNREELGKRLIIEESKKMEEELEIKKTEEIKRKMKEELKKIREEELENKKREAELKMKQKEEELENKRREVENRKRDEERKRRRKEELEKKRREEELEKKREEKELEEQRKEDLERKRVEQELQIKKREEELERNRKEELEKRKIEEERKRKEEIERKRREDEMDRKRLEEELERRKLEEELERQRLEELERIKIEEELERKRNEELERKYKEEAERIIREEELERKRTEELDKKKRKEELERKLIEEELLKKRREEELERAKTKRELERKRKEEELERKRKEGELERKRREEELEYRRLENIKRKEIEALEKKKIEEQLERKRIEEFEKRKEEEEERVRVEREDSDRRKDRERKELEEIEKKAQLKRKKLEEEEQLRREKDRMEIEKTKRRIAELKRERDEIKRQQAIRIQQLLKGEEVDENAFINEGEEIMKETKIAENKQEVNESTEKENSYEKDDDANSDKQHYSIAALDALVLGDQTKGIDPKNVHNVTVSHMGITIISSHTITNDDVIKSKARDSEVEEEEEEEKEESERIESNGSEIELRLPVTDAKERYSGGMVVGDNIEKSDGEGEGENEEKKDYKEESCEEGEEKDGKEVFYDHTVISAQHKIQFCTSSLLGSSGTRDEGGNVEKYNSFHTQHLVNSSSVSSEFDPLPPPIPPHNVDPATLVLNDDVLDQQHPTSLAAESEKTEPELMTPEEEKKLLSYKPDHRLLSDAEAKEVSLILSQATDDFDGASHSVPSEDSNNVEVEHKVDIKDTLELAEDEPPTDYEEEPSALVINEMSPEGFVLRAKEVLVEDGVHYFGDGHFWIEVPGLAEDDEDDEDEDVSVSVPVHKHTKLKFSTEPIRLFSTFSVTEYDRKNEDVDPVAASAEYELEKRVEKMDVFPVQIEKGDSGLGLSIIGMGVGADAGVEKLGIFVKTITPNGATEKDGRIRVNDQIIEVDSQSLVGVTQMFAASVLKSTSGCVNFLIGREQDPDNSEVAMLIRQSLLADQERDERRRALGGPRYDPHNTEIFESFSSPSEGNSPSEENSRNNFSQYDEVGPGENYGDEYGDAYGSCPASPPEGISSPPPEAFNHDVQGKELMQTDEIVMMSQHFQEVQHRNEMYEEEINILRNKISGLEKELSEKEDLPGTLHETTLRLQDIEDKLQSRQAEIATYQDMLEQSQGQYIILEKKYYKAKKIIKEYQSRERDFLHREEYHITQLEEKDALYNSLVKALKDRVIQLEGDLMKAQQQAGLPIKVPPDINSQSSSRDCESPVQKEPPRKPSTLSSLDADLSDNDGCDTHTSEGSKSSTVERKIPLKEELDVAVPPTELLDVSFSKAKGELASRGGLANRQLPSLKKTASLNSSSSFDHNLDDALEDSLPESQQLQNSSTSPSSNKSTTQSSNLHHEEVFHQTFVTSSSSSVPTSSSAALYTCSSSSSTSVSSMCHTVLHSSSITHGSREYGRPPPPYQPPHNQTTHNQSAHNQPPPYQPPPSAPLSHRPVIPPDSGVGRAEMPYRHPPPIARVQPVNRVETSDNPTVSPQYGPRTAQQQSLAHQLKALLAEREATSEHSGHQGHRDPSPVKKSPSTLMEDVRQAVIQADVSLGKKPMISGPIHVSSTAQVVSTGQFVYNRSSPQRNLPGNSSFPQRLSRDSGSWSPKLGRSGPSSGVAPSSTTGVVLLSKRPIDSSLPPPQTEDNVSSSLESVGTGSLGLADTGSCTSFDSQTSFSHLSEKNRVAGYSREIVSVFDWTKEQVAQWLVVQGLETYVAKFVAGGITGPRLINIDTKDLKSLGLSSDDKSKIKRKVKELRQNLEKERKQIEKENKEREKLQKKAEKLAEKAEKRRK